MTNPIAFALALLLIAALALDILAFQGTHALFLARRFAELADWIAFWR